MGEGVDVIDHDPDSASDSEKKKHERLRRTKEVYHIIFQEEPPKKFWSVGGSGSRGEKLRCSGKSPYVS